MFPGGMLDAQNESEYLRNSVYKLANSENIDGLISWGSTIGAEVSVEELNKFHEAFADIPYVTIGHKIPGHPCIQFDAYTGMKELMHHFIKVHGSRRFAFLRGPDTHFSACERYRAFIDALKEEKLATDGYEKLITDPFMWNDGENAFKQLHEKRKLVPGEDYDTLIGTSDMMLFSAVKYLQRYGFRIPQDVRVAAFNDSTESRISTTPFSTVHMPYEDIGRAAFKTIQNVLENPDDEAGDQSLPARVIIRESCGCNLLLEQDKEEKTEEVPPADRNEVKARLFEDLRRLFSADMTAAQALIEPLLDAFAACDTEKIFILLEHVLNRFFNEDGDVRQLFEAIKLTQHSGIVSEDYFHRINGLIYQRILQMQSSTVSFNKYESEKRASVINSLKCRLLSAHDREELIRTLKTHLPQIGIHTASIVLYENDEFSRYAGGFSKDTVHALSDPSGDLFPSKRLVPPQIESSYSAGSFLVQPLFIENQPLGYFITNIAFFEASVYEDLRSAISSALHGIFLFEQTLESKQVAERAERAKTEFFANIGSDLNDPLVEISSKLDQMETTIRKGTTDAEILTEQLVFIKAQVNAQLDKTNMLVDLTLSQVDDLAIEKRLFNISEIFPEQLNFPLLYGDPLRLAKAFSLINEEFNGGSVITMENDGIHITYSVLEGNTANWAKPTMLLAEKIILLHFGEFNASKDKCTIVLTYPNLAGLPPARNAKTPERILSFTHNLPYLSGFKLPLVENSTANYSELLKLDFTSSSLVAWDFDNSSMKDVVNMYSLRHHPDLFRAPLMCFAKKATGITLIDMLENAVHTKREEPVLFIDCLVTRYGSWAREENSISISSMDDFDSAVSQFVPSVIVFEKIDLEMIKDVRRRPSTVLVPILILPETIEPGPEVDEVCTLPRVLLCNRGVADSPQFSDRIREILSGDEILPPHTGALVKKAILYLNEHASQQIVRWKLADSVHVSEDYLTRIFHKEIGLSLWEYLNRYRIFLATDLLLNTNGTIYGIAEQTGFQDQAYFCRVFKKIHGVPPGKIRNKIEASRNSARN